MREIKEHPCITCGRIIRMTNNECNTCRKTSRICTSCGKVFNGISTKCQMCWFRIRICKSCNREFSGVTEICQPCSRPIRECSQCGKDFIGGSLLCDACRYKELPSNERKARGSQNYGIRKARELAAQITIPLPKSIYIKILESGPCVYCGMFATTIDHITPLARNGLEIESNLVPACKSCNSSKCDKLITEWSNDSIVYALQSKHADKIAAELTRILGAWELS